jgi:flagellar hook-associated protein 1 FlgK
MALSLGLDTAVKALRAHQLAVDVASHNIANAQSPGFSRQRVLLRPEGITGADWRSGDNLLGRAGMGVRADDVHRIRDIFLDFQARLAFTSRAQYEALATGIERAELTFNEPSDDGIASQIASFFSSWHDVVNDPESPAARVALVHSTTTLTTNLQRAYNDLGALRADINGSVVSLRNEVNARAEEIASLNAQIVQIEATGEKANDLRDRRDLLIDQLSQIAQVQYAENGNGAVNIYLGNHELVSDTRFDALEVANDVANPGMQKLTFSSDGTDVTTAGGRLRGLLDARDQYIPSLQAKLDTLASNLITRVNAVHTAGADLNGTAGLAFFTGTGAADIALNAAIAGDPRLVAASGGPPPGAVGDASNALAIANLQLAADAGLNNETFEQFYSNIASVLGADVSRARGLASSNDLLANHLEAQRQSVSGVNLDEEMVNLSSSQKAYQGAARVITTIDEMLDTLINRTGVVGR